MSGTPWGQLLPGVSCSTARIPLPTWLRSIGDLLQDFDLCPDDIERIQALCGKPNPESNEVVEKKKEKWIPGNSIESRIAFWGEYGKQKLKEIKLQY